MGYNSILFVENRFMLWILATSQINKTQIKMLELICVGLLWFLLHVFCSILYEEFLLIVCMLNLQA